MSDQSYFVMLTEPNREMTVQANFIIRGVRFYLPTIFRAARLPYRQHIARVDHPDVPIPLFPRIILVPEDEVGAKLDLIRTTPGLRSQPFMRFGEKEAMIRPLGIEVIRDIEASERERYLAKKHRKSAPAWQPKVGQRVSVITDEVLGGARGCVSSIDEKGRITILTEIMKRTVRVKVTANQIEPA